MAGRNSPFPKARLEALTDGIFAVAMTILVLDLRLPDDAAIHDQAGLIQALWVLEPKIIPYLLSFYVLGGSWLSLSRLQTKYKEVPASHARWSLSYLLLVTLVPFSTVVVGRFASYPVATWIYVLNIGVMAFIFHHLLPDSVDAPLDPEWSARRTELHVLMASCVLAAGLSLVFGGRALLAFTLNAVPQRWFTRRVSAPGE
jgi:uncharacterized membrane protein